MCGRSTLHDAPANVLEHFRLPPVLPGFEPRYNIAPTQDQWTIALDEYGAPNATRRRWGLVPSWAKDRSIGQRMINARAESLADKPSFRDALESRRCLVLADGYYEWTVREKGKVPMYFHLAGNRAFAMAGLWERWEGGDSPLETCTVVTTAAGARTSRYHHRMPVVLTLQGAESWLDRATPRASLKELLVPYEKEDLLVHEVSRMVNSPANDRAECMEPLSPVPASVR
ncbi:MAG: SOS response-associated peptidase [Gemmatimonadota bacterium]|nr:SOS response-associated peptidase [Gemmatimonadota bacterium]